MIWPDGARDRAVATASRCETSRRTAASSVAGSTGFSRKRVACAARPLRAAPCASGFEISSTGTCRAWAFFSACCRCSNPVVAPGTSSSNTSHSGRDSAASISVQRRAEKPASSANRASSLPLTFSSLATTTRFEPVAGAGASAGAGPRGRAATGAGGSTLARGGAAAGGAFRSVSSAPNSCSSRTNNRRPGFASPSSAINTSSSPNRHKRVSAGRPASAAVPATLCISSRSGASWATSAPCRTRSSAS